LPAYKKEHRDASISSSIIGYIHAPISVYHTRYGNTCKSASIVGYIVASLTPYNTDYIDALS